MDTPKMDKKTQMTIIVIIVVIIFLIILVALYKRANREDERHKKEYQEKSNSESSGNISSSDGSRDNESRREVATAKQSEEKIKTDRVETTAAEKKEVCSGVNEAPGTPVLRCYDYFEFPGQGTFHIKTCGAPPDQSTKRIFIQWFPVEGVDKYNVYCNEGPNVSKTNSVAQWNVPGNSYYFESEKLDGSKCWSLTVTAQNVYGESGESQIYTTCTK